MRNHAEVVEPAKLGGVNLGGASVTLGRLNLPPVNVIDLAQLTPGGGFSRSLLYRFLGRFNSLQKAGLFNQVQVTRLWNLVVCAREGDRPDDQEKCQKYQFLHRGVRNISIAQLSMSFWKGGPSGSSRSDDFAVASLWGMW